MKKLAVLTALTAFICAGLWAQAQTAQTPAPTKPVDTKKLYNEIAGDYDFDFQGQMMTVNFFEKDAKLFGAPEGEAPEEILPVQGSQLKFEVTPAGNGQLYELEFFRNDKGAIDRCTIKTAGMEIPGTKRAIKIA